MGIGEEGRIRNEEMRVADKMRNGEMASEGLEGALAVRRVGII